MPFLSGPENIDDDPDITVGSDLRSAILSTVRDQVRPGRPYTFTDNVRQEVKKRLDISTEEVKIACKRLSVHSGGDDLIYWHGLIIPADQPTLDQFIAQEADAGHTRQTLLGRCNAAKSSQTSEEGGGSA